MSLVTKRIPILGVFITFATTREEARAFAASKDPSEKLEGLETCHGMVTFVTDAQGLQHRIMMVFANDLNTVVHESVHAAWLTCRYCSIKASSSNEEPMAYLTAWLVEQMMGILDCERESRHLASAVPA